MSKARCGIWIDNAEAILVRFADDGEATLERIESEVAPRAKTKGGMRGTGGHVSGASHKKPEQKRLNQLNQFFGEVWTQIKDAESIAILGPGTAKKGLESEILGHHNHPEIAVFETSDNMTDPQLVARFRELFDV